jgi:hypothetical protein
MLLRDHDCAETIRRQLTSSHGPVSTACKNSAEQRSTWCVQRLARARERPICDIGYLCARAITRQPLCDLEGRKKSLLAALGEHPLRKKMVEDMDAAARSLPVHGAPTSAPFTKSGQMPAHTITCSAVPLYCYLTGNLLSHLRLSFTCDTIQQFIWNGHQTRTTHTSRISRSAIRTRTGRMLSGCFWIPFSFSIC